MHSSTVRLSLAVQFSLSALLAVHYRLQRQQAGQGWRPAGHAGQGARRPRPQKVDDTTEYVATLKSRDSAVVMPQVEGIITQIFVHSGEHVAAGAPLMQIDPAKQQATVKSQEDARAAQVAQVKWAKQNYDRVSGLANAGVVSKQDLDQARADPRRRPGATALARCAGQRAAGAVALLPGRRPARRNRRRRSRPRRRSRADHHRNSPPSIVPAASKPTSTFPIEKSAQLKMNLPVQIVDGSGKKLATSRITFISPQVDNSTQTVLAKATIANSNDCSA